MAYCVIALGLCYKNPVREFGLYQFAAMMRLFIRLMQGLI
jgi:hypothetical protein